MDGQSLSNLLHRKGVNVRYLGKIAELADSAEPRLQAFKALAVQEMVSRAFKHIANAYLKGLPLPFVASCVAHLLNCLIGVDYNSSPEAILDADLQALYSDISLDFTKVTPKTLQTEIETQIKLRFRHSLDSDWMQKTKHVQMLREIALKLGLQLGIRDYVFTKPANGVANGVVNGDSHTHVNGTNGINGLAYGHSNGHSSGGKKKKNKNAGNNTPTDEATSSLSPQHSRYTFQPSDILNIVPVIKDAAPKSVLAEEAFEAGRLSVLQSQKELGQELLLESLSLHEQIYGILHPEVARIYYQLSSLFYQLEDKGIAVELARKAVIVSERILGVDSSDTILSYLNLGLLEHSAGNTHAALAYIRHALDLWKLVYGPAHPDSITTLNNAAVMLQQLKLYHSSRLWFEASLSVSQQVSGPNHTNTATLLFQLAQALALDGDSKAAVGRMREAYNIYYKELGAENANTREAETWLEQLTQNAVTIAKHAKDVQAKKLRRINQLSGSSRMASLGSGPLPQTGRPETELMSSSGAGMGRRGLESLDERSIDELLNYIEGGENARTTPKKRAAHPKRRQQRAA